MGDNFTSLKMKLEKILKLAVPIIAVGSFIVYNIYDVYNMYKEQKYLDKVREGL